MTLSRLEQLSLVVDTLSHDPLPHVGVRAFGCAMFMRYDEGGMPLTTGATTQGDWTIGLPEEVRAALRAIVAARYAKRPAPPALRATVRAWVEAQLAGDLGAELGVRRAKYLEVNPTGQLRRLASG